jgi:hypothetical protein
MFKKDPFLSNASTIEQGIIITAFAARVRSGFYGHGNEIKVSLVSDALAAISKTIELVGKQSPVYRYEETYTLPVQRCIEGMRRVDSPAIPQLAVPVAVPIEMAREAYATSSTRAQATGDLGLIAFFYLLRVGEYTAPRVVVKNGRIVHATRTKQFRVINVGFFKDGKLLNRKSPLAKLLEADSATLKISNQKNGRMGQTIHHETSEGFNSCVRALARRIHHILTNGGNMHSLISTYHDGDKLNTITPDDIRRSIRQSIKTLK